MLVYKAPNDSIIKAWTDGVPVESAAIDQLRNTASLPFIYKWIAAMPDVHYGKGSTIGSVVPTQKAIIPAAVGVDIGCGMIAAPTNLVASDLPDSLESLRLKIEDMVPTGQPSKKQQHAGVWSLADQPLPAIRAWQGGTREHPASLNAGLAKIMAKSPGMVRGKTHEGLDTAVSQLCTLGGGNHFIEVCLDEEDTVWVMLHSGSRGIGSKIGTYFIDVAKSDMKKWMIRLPDEDLAYLPTGTEHFNDYWEALNWAQEYARINRELMLDQVFLAMGLTLGRNVMYTPGASVFCHHNYVALENHFGQDVYVTRKGAVRARLGDLGIIPGSMGTRSYIVRGLGNPDSFMSSAHGAGRAMSRSAARKAFTLADHEAATSGIECRKDDGVLDETPGAYKSIDQVMAAQTDLVETVHELRQVICVKG